MHAVVTAVRNSSNALIESPTGTGKSLALLCSSLAVRKHIEEHTQLPPSSTAPSPPSPPPSRPPPPPPPPPPVQPPSKASCAECDDDDDDFAPPKQFRDTSWQKRIRHRTPSSRQEQPHNSFMFDRIHPVPVDSPLDPADQVEIPSQTQTNQQKVPRIFYATRTHSQVTQLIAELRKTKYNPKISILASRNEYCINSSIRNAPNRDENCKLLVKAKVGGCPFHFMTQSLAESQELEEHPWDIEELVQLGKRHSACPYYASHLLYQQAQLILCPYSFLIDPICRKARGINVSDDIVILDEAHNIESYARESASFEVDIADLSRAAQEIDNMLMLNDDSALTLAYAKVKALLYNFITMAENIVSAREFQAKAGVENAVFEREDIIVKLQAAEIKSDEIPKWRQAYEFIINYGDGDESKRANALYNPDDAKLLNSGEQKPSSASVLRHSQTRPLGGNRQNTGYGYGCDPNNRDANRADDDDYGRPKKFPRKRYNGRSKRGDEPRAWVSKGLSIVNEMLTTLEYFFEHTNDFALVIDRRTANFVTAIKASLCCLNAAICFREISSKARSVIVASGTMTPISSFAGELGTTFSISKTLPHVVRVQNQLFVGVVGEGPGKVLFDATFRGSSSFAFQDALGNALVDYCKVIPGGVLVFFPSYRMMEQLQARWKASGVWEELARNKGAVLTEPNQRGEDFDNVVNVYQTASYSETGALLLAVCRGKLSEGIDFRDASSRAVVLIGIPFPYIGDVVVNRKKAWNDRTRAEKKRSELQSGNAWYEMQAYRALNQALGRTLRHRYDYGAILLVDCRFRSKRVSSQLPGWTQQALKRTNDSHESIIEGLKQFYSTVQKKIMDLADEDQRRRRLPEN